jgi:hypothetical protein
MTEEDKHVRTHGLSQGVSLKKVEGSDHVHGPMQTAVDPAAAGLDVDYEAPLDPAEKHPERHGHPHHPGQPTVDPAGVPVPASIEGYEPPTSEDDPLPDTGVDPSHGPLDLATKKHEHVDPEAEGDSEKPGTA